MKEFNKKDAILDAMLDLVAKNGFHNSPMADVAKQANVAAGTIYHYFKSKDELMKALYVRHKLKMNEVLFKTDEPNKPFKDRFRLFFNQSYKHYTANKKDFIFYEQFVNSPYMSQFSKDELFKLDQPIYDFIRKAIFTQAVRDISPKILSALILGCAHSLVKLQLSGEYIISNGELDTSFSIVWDGMKKA